MSSEIQASEKEEWLKHKTIVGLGLGDIVACARQKLKDMIPSIKAIKDKQLWRHGGYDSFKDFCQLGLSVTSQRIYQLLAEGDARKLLEFQQIGTSNFTPEGKQEPSKKPEKKAKAREIKPATVIDAETGKPEPKTIEEHCGKPAGSFAQSLHAEPQQIELDFTVQITAGDDDRRWFQNLTPIERGQAIARARQQP